MNYFTISDFSNDTRYTAAVARVRSLESRLLSGHKLTRMADKTDWQELLNELRASDYFEPLTKVRFSIDIESALFEVLRRRYSLLHELAVEPRLISAIISWHDFSNLKILLKQKWNQPAAQQPLSDLGLVTTAALEKSVEADSGMPPPLREAWLTATEDFENNRSIFRVEMLIDSTYLKFIHQQFQNSGIPFLQHFISHRIDLINIQMVLRWRLWNGQASMVSELLPAGGFLSLDQLKFMLNESPDKVVNTMRYSPYHEIFSTSMANDQQNYDLQSVEKQCDDFMTNFCAKTRYTSFGVEPLIAFLWLALKEFRNVQLIVTGNRASLPVQSVKNRLRWTYA